LEPGSVEDALPLLRRLLAAEPDGTVVIAQVGFSTNLARLLDSPPDDITPLSGRELVTRKVKLLSVMAGAFTKIPDDKGKPTDHREYNVVEDLSSARRLAEGWPTPIVWSGFEIGLSIPYPSQSILRDYGYVEHHPLAEAYHLYTPPPHDRPTWDLTSVLYAVLPDAGYFGLSPQGKVVVTEDGLTNFNEESGGRDRYLTVSPEQRVRVTEALVQLSSQPPAAVAGR
jgi:inosine-uridine nucleoside N-ribohydrolase